MDRILGTNWRSTLGNTASALGTAMVGAKVYWPAAPDWILFVGVLVGILGKVFAGVNTRDTKVSDEQAGAGQK